MKKATLLVALAGLLLAGQTLAEPLRTPRAAQASLGPPISTLTASDVLTTTELNATTGSINWRKAACWTGVVTVAVAGGFGGSPGVGAVLSAALAVYCLTL